MPFSIPVDDEVAIDRDKALFLKTYKHRKLHIESYKGCYYYTREGKFLDMLSGIGVTSLGGKNEQIQQAIIGQLNRFSHVSNYFLTDPAVKLARYLIQNTFASNVFFTNSGTETMEAGLKIIKKFANKQGKQKIVVFNNGFHGRSLGSLSITAQKKLKKGIDPLIPNIVAIDFNDLQAIEKEIDENCAGVVMEVVQGNGGVIIADQTCMKRIRELCSKHDALLFIDEIQTGIGRTGKFLSYEHFGIEPDMCALAKAIGGGLPLGALLVNKKLSDIFTYGDHGSTFGGNPISCAAGLEMLKQVNTDTLLENVTQREKQLEKGLKSLQKKYKTIARVELIGLMCGVALSKNEQEIVKKLEEKKILTALTSGNVLRLLPPLIITEEQIASFLTIFEDVLKSLEA